MALFDLVPGSVMYFELLKEEEIDYQTVPLRWQSKPLRSWDAGLWSETVTRAVEWDEAAQKKQFSSPFLLKLRPGIQLKHL